jgi:hypothetical protein
VFFAVVVSLSLRLLAMRARFFLIDYDYLGIGVFLAAMITIGKTVSPSIEPELAALTPHLLKYFH